MDDFLAACREPGAIGADAVHSDLARDYRASRGKAKSAGREHDQGDDDLDERVAIPARYLHGHMIWGAEMAAWSMERGRNEKAAKRKRSVFRRSVFR